MAKKRDIRLIDRVQKDIGLSDDQREMLHRDIHGLRLKYQEIVEKAKEIRRDYPNK
jgi:hypothetical protein